MFTNMTFTNVSKLNTHSNMVLVISEAVSTSEKFNGKIKKTTLNHDNEAVHAWIGLICCLLRHSVSKFYSSQVPIPNREMENIHLGYNLMENWR